LASQWGVRALSYETRCSSRFSRSTGPSDLWRASVGWGARGECHAFVEVKGGTRLAALPAGQAHESHLDVLQGGWKNGQGWAGAT